MSPIPPPPELPELPPRKPKTEPTLVQEETSTETAVPETSETSNPSDTTDTTDTQAPVATSDLKILPVRRSTHIPLPEQDKTPNGPGWKWWLKFIIVTAIVVAASLALYLATGPHKNPGYPQAQATPLPPEATQNITAEPGVKDNKKFALPSGKNLNFGLPTKTTWGGNGEWEETETLITGNYTTTVDEILCSAYITIIPNLQEELTQKDENYVYDSYLEGYLQEPTVAGSNTVATTTYVKTNLPAPDENEPIPGRHFTIPTTSKTEVYSTLYAGIDFSEAPETLVSIAYGCQSEAGLQKLQQNLNENLPENIIYMWIS